jgi:hypothetical protein
MLAGDKMKFISIGIAGLLCAGIGHALAQTPSSYTLNCVSAAKLSPVQLSFTISADPSHRRLGSIYYVSSTGAVSPFDAVQVAQWAYAPRLVLMTDLVVTGIPVFIFIASPDVREPNGTFSGTVTEYPGAAPNRPTYTGDVKCTFTANS